MRHRIMIGLGVLCIASSAAGAEATVSFRVQDRLDEAEVDETTTLFIDDRPVGTFHLDASVPNGSIDVTVPSAESYSYAFCGHITFRQREGGVTTHRVDNGGTLHDVNGRVFEALGAQDFTLFYLADQTEGKPPAPVSIAPTGRCQTPTS